jgi:hypothetical protein
MRTALSEGVKRFLFIALLLSFCNLPLPGATLERLSLGDMIAKSTVIVRAKVTDSSAAYSITSPVIYTHYTVQVSEWLKGLGAKSIDVVVPGGTVGNSRQSFSGAPAFSSGDEYVFFLWTSKAGLTQVIGLTQGLFSVAQDGSKDPMTTRSASHELMLDPGTAQPVKDQPLVMHLSELKSRIVTTLSAPGPVPVPLVKK